MLNSLLMVLVRNIYIRLGFGWVNTINTYLRIKNRVVWGEILALNSYYLNKQNQI